MADAVRWRLLRSGAGAPAWNMALDEALLASDDPRPALRLYAWDPPALSLGWFQPAEAFADAAARAGVEIVRRPTGGGAIHHTPDEVTFALVATPGRDGYPAGRVAAYRAVHGWIASALARLGAPVRFRGDDAPLSTRPRDARLCFLDATALDLVDGEGRKVVGSAQRHRGGRVLHHGSIPLHEPSLSPGCGSVNAAAGRTGARALGWDAVADGLIVAFAEGLGARWQRDAPSPAEEQAARRHAGRREAGGCGTMPARSPRGGGG